MIILAIDPGVEKVGYSVFEKNAPNDYRFLTSGLIQTSKKEAHEQRLKQIYDKLKELAEDYKAQLLVMEKLFFFKNQKTVISVAQAQGVVELLAAQKNTLLYYLTPLQIKQIVTGYGNADKKSVHKMLTFLLGKEVQVEDDDESDAIACGIAYCCLNEKLM